MKLLLLLDNARMLLAAVREHVATTSVINHCSLRVASTFPGSKKRMQFLIQRLLERDPPHDRLEQDALVMASAIKHKTLMHAQFTGLKSDALRARNAVVTRSTASNLAEEHDEAKQSVAVNPTNNP